MDGGSSFLSPAMLKLVADHGRADALCRANDVEGMRALLKTVPDKNEFMNAASDSSRRAGVNSILFCNPRPEMLRFLLAEGANPLAAAFGGITVLMDACRCWRATMDKEVEILMPCVRSQIDCRDASGHSALEYAIIIAKKYGGPANAVVLLLMQNGALTYTLSRPQDDTLDHILWGHGLRRIRAPRPEVRPPRGGHCERIQREPDTLVPL